MSEMIWYAEIVFNDEKDGCTILALSRDALTNSILREVNKYYGTSYSSIEQILEKKPYASLSIRKISLEDGAKVFYT